MKKIITLTAGICCFVLTILASCQKVPVQAAERKAPPYILDARQECLLTIRTGVDQRAAGKKLALYQVGKIDATSLSLSFVPCEPYEEAKVDLVAAGQEERKGAIDALCEFVTSKKMTADQTVKLDKKGTAQLEVSQGVYLICQAEESDTKIQATLVSVPYVSESLNEWIYDMEVELKAVEQSVPTGDTQDFTGYTALAVAAVLLLMLLLFARKRVKRN